MPSGNKTTLKTLVTDKVYTVRATRGPTGTRACAACAHGRLTLGVQRARVPRAWTRRFGVQELKGELKHIDSGRALWQHTGYAERARVVHARVIPLQDKKTEFAQVTVRLHTQQTLAGPGPQRTRDAVEYIVLESVITDKTPWRICGRLTPKWAVALPAPADATTKTPTAGTS